MSDQSTTDKLGALAARCKCSVSVTINQHRDMYQSAEEFLRDEEGNWFKKDEIPADIRSRMISTNTIVLVQFYPVTPIGFFAIWDVDLGDALDRALCCFGDEGQPS